MKTEQSLKNQCTPEFIKWMCEFAEGFEYKFFEDFKNRSDWSEVIHTVLLPLLIHRAVEGVEKHFISISYWKIRFQTDDGRNAVIKEYLIENYQPQSLTQAECAMLHCLIDIFEDVRS